MSSHSKHNRAQLKWQRKVGAVIIGIISVVVAVGIVVSLYHLVKFHW